MCQSDALVMVEARLLMVNRSRPERPRNGVVVQGRLKLCPNGGAVPRGRPNESIRGWREKQVCQDTQQPPSVEPVLPGRVVCRVDAQQRDGWR